MILNGKVEMVISLVVVYMGIVQFPFLRSIHYVRVLYITIRVQLGQVSRTRSIYHLLFTNISLQVFKLFVAVSNSLWPIVCIQGHAFLESPTIVYKLTQRMQHDDHC